MQSTLPWILALLAVAILLLAGVLWARRRPDMSQVSLPNDWAVTARPVFNTDERRVYRLLREALPHHVLLSKLPLVRFCQANDAKEVNYWFGLLGSVHVSFVVCSPNGRVLAAIDVEGERPPTKRTLQIKQSVLAACRIRYLRCAANNLPSIAELQLLVPYSNAASRGPQAAPAPSARVNLPAKPAATRPGRQSLWQDASMFQDSFFAPDNRFDSLNPADFPTPTTVGLAPVASGRQERAVNESVLPESAFGDEDSPHDIVGIVVDNAPVEPRSASR